MSKKHIFFCDDKEKWTENFKKLHGNEFEVTTTNKSREFKPELEKLIKAGEKPDIILIDLYHPRNPPGPVQDALNVTGQAAIDRLKEAIKEEKKHIEAAWAPDGFEMLKDARKLCPDVPIAIYTEQGLTLAGDEELIKVSTERGEWMLKGQTEFYETCRLRSMLVTKHYADVTKKTLWIFAAIIFVAALAYSFVVEQSIVSVLSFGATLTSVLLAIMPHFITELERRTRKTG